MNVNWRNSSFLSGNSPRPTTSSMLNRSFKLKESRLSTRPSAVNVVLKSSNNVVERFGLAVPVLIEEALSFSDKNTVITARVSGCGYAWVVCGRRLFIWEYQDIHDVSPLRAKFFPVCHELRLPQSDLAHRAELVSVFRSKISNYPSCVAVSPEGMVRYWPDITHDHCSVDEHVYLNGQECDSLVEAGNLGCIFVTTSCTVVLVQYKKGTYEHKLHCRTLKTPGTWLGGFSKRVSSIFFGPMASDQGNETKIIRLLAVPGIQQIYNIYVLAGLNFQHWTLSEPDPEQLLWSIDLARPLKGAFRAHIAPWDTCDPSLPDIDVWILDMQPDKDGILMLCAAVNLQMSPQVYYAMMSVSVNSPVPPTQPKDFLLIKLMGLYKDDNPGETLNYRFTLCGNIAYIYTTKTITVIKPEEDPDPLEFLHPSDHIFSGSTCLNVPVFFSRQHGIVSVKAVDSVGDTTLSTSLIMDPSIADQSECGNNLSLYLMDPNEIYNAHRDTVGQVKAAFIFHVKNQLTECYYTVNKLFPAGVSTLPGYDGPLDTVVIKIAKDILDDIPAGDPRWHDEIVGNEGVGSSHSMLVLQQMKDKQKAYSLYVTFLKESGLWDKLSGTRVRDKRTATIHLLAELAEKITAAIVMKSLPATGVFANALERTVQNYSTQMINGLSREDVFYREITRIHEGILWLAKVCEDSSHSSLGPTDVAKTIHEGNQIMLTVLTEVMHYRQQTAGFFELNEVSRSMRLEYLPWTAAGGPEGLIDALMLQHSLTVNYGFKVTGEGELKNVLLEEFVMLTDFILDGRKTHLASVRASREKLLYKQYCSDRNKLIRPLIEARSYEKAAMLAEKYLDFEILVSICAENNNDERLDEYMGRFKDTGFVEFVYNWYLRQGKQAYLLDRYRKIGEFAPEGAEKLRRFLEAYPSLSWLQHIFDKDFASAADVLRQLAETEVELLTRQKTMFSLSKLAKLAAPLASDTEDHIEDINKRLELISYQEYLPDYVLQQYGFDAHNPRVLRQRDIIALYICTEYVDATELDFQRALDVAGYVEEESEKVDLILQIWRTALLRDKWEFFDTTDPIECLQRTLFFKIVDLAIALGYNPNNLLPPIGVLLDDPSMEELNKNKHFQALLKTGYEHFHRTQMI